MAEFFAKLGIGVDTRPLSKGTAALDKLSASAARAERNSAKLSKGFKVVGLGIGIITTGFSLLAKKIISATSESEAALAQLAAGIKSTNAVAGKSIDELVAKSAELQKATNFDDESIQRAQAVLLTFTKVTGDNFDRATEAVADMATRLGGDLNGAAIQIGKALQDPIKGVTALGRAGVQFSEDQKAMIDALVKTGDVAGAQNIILKELDVQFANSARAARDTMGGAVKSLGNAFDDLFESGNSESSKELRKTIEDLTASLQDTETIKGAAAIAGSIVSMTTAIINSATSTANFIHFLGETLKVRVFQDASTSDDLAIVGREIDILTSKLKAATDQREYLKTQFSGPLLAGFNAKQIEIFTRQLDIAKAHEKNLLEPRKLQKPGSGPPTTVESVEVDPTATAAAARRQKEAADAAKAAFDSQKSSLDGLVQGMRERIAVFGLEGEASQLSALIQLGNFDKLSAADQARAIDLAKQVDALEARAATEKKAAEDEAKRAEQIKGLYESNIEVITGLDAESQRYGETLGELNQLLDAGALSQEGYTAAVDRLGTTLDGTAEKVDAAGKQMTQFSDQAGRNIQDILAGYLEDPFKGGLDGMVKNFAKAMQQMVSQALAADLLNAIGLGGSDNKGGNVRAMSSGLGQLFGGLFGGARANGGPVTAGVPYLVGERRPEIFVPNSSGRILPNMSGLSGGTVVNVQNIVQGGTVETKQEKGPDGSIMIKNWFRAELKDAFASGSMDKIMAPMGARRRGF